MPVRVMLVFLMFNLVAMLGGYLMHRLSMRQRRMRRLRMRPWIAAEIAQARRLSLTRATIRSSMKAAATADVTRTRADNP